MWTATAAPWLQQAGLAQGVFTSRQLYFWGIGESTLAEQIEDLLAGANPTVAPYAGGGDVMLRLTACADCEEAGMRLLEPVEADLRQRFGDRCFGRDDDTLASVVLSMLRQAGQTVATAESCTGGGLGAALTAVPGSSDVVLGGVIAYANSVKQAVLGVPSELLEADGAVSSSVATAMAEGVRSCTGADWGVAITGIAGPGGGTAAKPVGLVHVAVAGPDACISSARRYGDTRGREWVRRLSAGDALDQLRLRLLAQSRES